MTRSLTRKRGGESIEPEQDSTTRALGLAGPFAALAAFVLAALAALSSGCMVRPRMCAAEADCTGRASCVAGRCVAHGASAAIDTGRRLVFLPVDVAYVGPHAAGLSGATVPLGRDGDGAAVVLSRFSAALPAEAVVLEAYVVLERPPGVDGDPAPVVLHAARIVEPWDSRSVSWVRAPRIEEVGAPITRVFPASGPLVRLDVRPLVQRWRRRVGDDFGVAVVADSSTPSGVVVALAPRPGDEYDPVLASVAPPAGAPSSLEARAGASEAPAAHPGGRPAGPRLEVYVR